jgi:hypothetical protein
MQRMTSANETRCYATQIGQRARRRDSKTRCTIKMGNETVAEEEGAALLRESFYSRECERSYVMCTFSFARAELSQGCDLKNREWCAPPVAGSAAWGWASRLSFSRRLLLRLRNRFCTQNTCCVNECVLQCAMGERWLRRCAHPHETKTHGQLCVKFLWEPPAGIATTSRFVHEIWRDTLLYIQSLSSFAILLKSLSRIIIYRSDKQVIFIWAGPSKDFLTAAAACLRTL